METLATKYRPKEFSDVVSQEHIVESLNKQIVEKTFKNVYLFTGSSGCGKTTIARIMANMINNGEGHPIEIDAASNNGVDKIRNIVDHASERDISTYKVIIIDECHVLTNAAWQAFLKCLEEPPKYTIFIFCTTDPQKIPDTILNRVMRFNLTRIPTDKIKERLLMICREEKFTNYEESVDYIAKLANGGMRDAIALLDKVAAYSTDFKIETTLDVLGDFSYKIMFDLTNAIIDGNDNLVITTIEDLYNKGYDLKLFIEHFLDFALDLFKYSIFRDLDSIKIPGIFKEDLIYTVGEGDSKNYYSRFVDRILEIKNAIKYDTNLFSTIEVMMIKMCRGV